MKRKIIAGLIAAMISSCTAWAGAPLIGDADLNGRIEAADSAAVMQKVLKSSYKMPIEQYENYMDFTDINRDGILDSGDAAEILQKSLNSSYEFQKANDEYLSEAQIIFSAAQSYVTDKYAETREVYTDVSVDDLIEVGFIKEKPTGIINIEVKKDTAEVERVTYNGISFPDEGIVTTAKTIFTAAQTYITDRYATDLSICTDVTIDDLVDAGLLTKKPSGRAYIRVSHDSPVVVYVTYNGVSYPYCPGDDFYAEEIFTAAQSYVTDTYAKDRTVPQSLTVRELVKVGLLPNISYSDGTFIKIMKDAPIVEYVVYGNGIFAPAP